MQEYFGNAPKPPPPLLLDPPPTNLELAEYSAAMAQYSEDKAAYVAEHGPAPQPAPVSVPSAPGGGAGKPAARMGDMTAHGGSIVVGVPTVLVGNKPAAVVGQRMHTCPMVTGVVPHVGGPVLPPGSTTVLIGNMPAARMGDQATCTGPPDTIAQGEPTVLIG
jgi:uncharacterized Zn-binding protein involved in type VI secretion